MEYLEKEHEVITRIYERLEEENNRHLDFESLYPEYKLSERVVGIFDRWSLFPRKLPDLFPFYETILCVVNMAQCSSDKSFQDTYGCSYNDFLNLVEMDKIVPVISANPYLQDEQYSFFAQLLKIGPPSTTRYMRIMQEDYLQEVLHDTGIAGLQLEAIRVISFLLDVILKNHGIKDPEASKLLSLVQRPVQRGDLGLAGRYLDYISIWLENDPHGRHTVGALIEGLLQIEDWNEQPYLAPGVTLNYSDQVSNVLQEEADLKPHYFTKLMSMLGDIPEDALQSFRVFAESSLILSGDRLALLKDTFFYEPPEVYGDVVKYAYWLSKSDNVKENIRIAKTLSDDIAKGKFKDAQGKVQDNSYKKIINEINREIGFLEKASKVAEIPIKFGANMMGAITGAFVGQRLASNEVALLFAFLGANAMSAMLKDDVPTISKHTLMSLFRRSNTAFLIWEKLKKDKK